MKKSICFLLLSVSLMLSNHNVSGQNSKIAVVHGGVSTFYSNLNAAVTAATGGDTIYLPGGPIATTGNITINKQLTIVGAGHYPDSTMATYQTVLTRQIFVITGSDNGCISGIKNLNLSIGNGTSNSANVNNYRIERCFISGLNLYNGTDGTGCPQNIIVDENIIISSIGGYSAVSVLFLKNIWEKECGYSYPATFLNNIFYASIYSPSFGWGINSTFNNNIIIHTNVYQIGSGNYNIFNNNLFCTIQTSGGLFGCNSTCVCNNNIDGQLASVTFMDAMTNGFSYSNDYHLKPSSPGVNAGTDGTDVGIYGTLVPYKEAAVPFNPHISSKQISTTVSATGKLGVNVKAVAQDR